jgi:hypothetical protein
VKRGSAWKATAWAPTTMYLAPASFNAANRSLKSRFTIGAAPPGDPLDDHIPHHLHTLRGRDGSPELPVECAIIGMPEDPGEAGEAFGATIHGLVF